MDFCLDWKTGEEYKKKDFINKEGNEFTIEWKKTMEKHLLTKAAKGVFILKPRENGYLNRDNILRISI